MRAVAVTALLFGRCSNAAQWPVHSWATVPVFFHSSTLNLLVPTAEDLAIMARYPVVTIEKWQGCNSTGAYPGPAPAGSGPVPTQGQATQATAAALKKLRPSISVITWFDSLRVYSNRTLNPSARDLAEQFCVNNDVSPFLEAHAAEYLLHNSSGGLALESYCNFHVYDHTRPSVRAFWRAACLNATASGLVDGCGADASQQTAAYVRGLSPAVAAAWTPAHVQAVADTTAALAPAGGVVLGKVVEQLGAGGTNGVLQEGCTASNATVNNLRAAAARAAADGARYLYECHGDASESALAAFLAGAAKDHYFGFGLWVTPNGGYADGWLPAFDRPLGAPSADAAYDASTSTWTRTFASGTHVAFNARTNVGTVTWAALI